MIERVNLIVHGVFFLCNGAKGSKAQRNNIMVEGVAERLLKDKCVLMGRRFGFRQE